jgi:probable F420-dependent oxidoreductase
MSKLDLGPIGVALNVSADETYLDQAAELEQLGYSAVWLPGGQLDSLDPIAKIAAATTAIPVATGFIVGLGGPQKPQPLQALNDYLDQLDQGDPPVPAARRILAAIGPRKLELARDRAAGSIPLLVTPAYTSAARRILGEESALIIDQMVVLDIDAARARETARGPLRFLSGVGGYQASFTRMGFTDTDIADLSDRLVDELVAWGDAGAITARVREHLTAGADQVVLQVLNAGDQPGPIEVARQLAGSLLP